MTRKDALKPHTGVPTGRVDIKGTHMSAYAMPATHEIPFYRNPATQRQEGISISQIYNRDIVFSEILFS